VHLFSDFFFNSKRKINEKLTIFASRNLFLDKKGQINADNDKTGMIKKTDDIQCI